MNYTRDILMIKLLIIDDDRDFLQIFDYFVKKAIKSCEISKLDDPTDIFQSYSNKQLSSFDVIISDYNMKKIDGIQLINFLKCNSVNTSFILCSSYDLPNIEDNHKEKPFDYYVQKRPNVKAFFREMTYYINSLIQKKETNIRENKDILTAKINK
jgi:DNA-binding NtrC family response regulator